MFVASGAKRSLPAPLSWLSSTLCGTCAIPRRLAAAEKLKLKTRHMWTRNTSGSTLYCALLGGPGIASTPIVHNVNSPLCPRLLRTSGAQKYLFRCCLLLFLLSSLPSVGRRRGRGERRRQRSLLGCDHPEREQFVSISRVKGLARRPPSRRPHLKHASSNQTRKSAFFQTFHVLYIFVSFSYIESLVNYLVQGISKRWTPGWMK